jgi:hypothetical protein
MNPIQLIIGQWVALNAVVQDANGITIPGQDSAIVWGNSNTAAVTLKQMPTGVMMAQAIAAGSANITATDGAATNTLTINVVASQVPTTLFISIGTIEGSFN